MSVLDNPFGPPLTHGIDFSRVSHVGNLLGILGGFGFGQKGAGLVYFGNDEIGIGRARQGFCPQTGRFRRFLLQPVFLYVLGFVEWMVFVSRRRMIFHAS